jgi:hypothetical protein
LTPHRYVFVIDGTVLSACSTQALEACIADWLAFKSIRVAA